MFVISDKKQRVVKGLRKKDISARGVLADWVNEKNQDFIKLLGHVPLLCMQKRQNTDVTLACNLFGN